jgi:hypothetical protein
MVMSRHAAARHPLTKKLQIPHQGTFIVFERRKPLGKTKD